MKITEQEFEKGGNDRKRIVFAVGFEEIEILHAVLVKTMSTFPIIKDEDNHTSSRMKNMAKVMSVYLGKSKPRPVKTSDTPCPYCDRQARGERALENHLKDVHPYKSKKKSTKSPK